MILWDIAAKYVSAAGPTNAIPRKVIKVPNGHPLPESTTGEWVRLETAISGDQAEHLLNTKYASVTQAKC